jgi:hypothetical protein
MGVPRWLDYEPYPYIQHVSPFRRVIGLQIKAGHWQVSTLRAGLSGALVRRCRMRSTIETRGELPGAKLWEVVRSQHRQSH